jgi:glycosyltransferase involved in cell wall biosynthesis
VPITGPPSRINNLLSWLSEVNKFNGEVILVHDVSDSDTVKLLAKTQSKIGNSFNLKIIEGKFGSPGAARNAGKRIAESTWVAFWDCDDIPNVKNVNQLLESSAGDELDFLCGSFDVVDVSSQKSVTQHINSGNPTTDLKQIALNPGIWRFVFKRTSIESVFFLEISMAEDQDFLMDFNLTKRSGRYSHLITYSYYRGEQGQLTSTKSAFSDLEISIKYLKRCRRNRERNIYLETIYLRQIITGILRGSVRVKIFCSQMFIKMLFSLGNRTTFDAFSLVFSSSKRKLVSNA